MSGTRAVLRPALLAAVLLVAGCSAAADGPSARTAPSERVATEPTSPAAATTDVPVPGSTLAPDVLAEHLAPDGPTPEGLEVTVLLPPEPDAATTTLAEGVDRWATEHGSRTVRRVVTDGDGLQQLLDAGTGAGHLVVAPGAALVDPLDSVAAQNLGVDFLVLGAQLVEPTQNVTAVVWPGASIPGAAGEQPADDAVTPQRADAAVAAGAASVLTGLTGIVVDLAA
jgi:hypothetical protein